MMPIAREKLNVMVIYKNYRHYHGISHIGLGVSALNNAKTLNEMGIRTQVFPIENANHIEAVIAKQAVPPTHVIIQAIWVPPNVMGSLIGAFPDTQFAAVCHSNVGFLQAEPNAINMFKEYIQLERESVNFHSAGNCLRFCQSIENSFTEPCTYLPNMYWLHHKHGEPKRIWRDIGGTIKIGIFGASRVYKNILSGAMAAIEVSSNMGAPTELYINCGRDDGGAQKSNSVRQAVKNLCAGLPNITVKEVNWASWTQFLRVVGSMNILMQPSYSESFNIVTADGCAEGIPSVVSDAIQWAPKSWVADVDDASDIARVGCGILNDPMAATTGFNALKRHNASSKEAWLQYLLFNRFGNA